ncbi:LysR family transcriptional regulator [Corynebacterium riegelii]
MDTRNIHSFIAVHEEASFSKAAAILGISQPLVSQRVRRLEQEVGAELIAREYRPLRLTVEGETFLPHAREIARAEKNALDVLKHAQKGVRGRVSLGYAGASVNSLLPPLAQQLRKELPAVELDLVPMIYAGEAQGLVADGKLDLAFSKRPLVKPELNELLVEFEEIVLALPPTHPLASEPVIDLEKLKHESWIMLEDLKGSGLRGTALKLLESAGIKPKITQTAPDSYTLLAMVSAGLGCTITLSTVVRSVHADVAIAEIRGGRRYLEATLVWRSDPSPVVEAVATSLKSFFAEPRRPTGRLLP